MSPKCVEPDCIRPTWKDALCWWCWQARAARLHARQIGLDSPAPSNPSLGPMTHEDAREG